MMLLSALLFLAWMPAFAAASPLDCPPPISFAHYQVNYFQFDGQGIEVDLLKELSRRTGCEFVTSVMPRARIWSELRTGHLDMAGSAVQTAEREKFVWFLPYIAMKNVAVYYPARVSISDAASILDNPAVIVGVVRPFRHGAAIDALIERLRGEHPERVVDVVDQLGLFKMLQTNRVQVVFAQPPAYQFAARRLGMSGFALADIAPSEAPIGHCLVLARRRFDAAAVARWRAMFEELHRDGTLRAILRKYLPSDEVDRFLSSPG